MNRSTKFDFLEQKHDGGDWKLSSPFGNRTLNGKNQFHGGIDIGCYTWTKLYSPFDNGVIKLIRPGSPSAGNYIIVYYPDKDLTFRFLHLHQFASNLKVEQNVNTETLLAYTGNTGASSGAHLHLDVTKGKEFISQDKCIDPLSVLS